MPEVVKGYPQIPLEGVSFQSTFASADVPTPKETGFFSMLGSRAIWHKGWKAVTVHPTISGWGHFDQDRWELYDTDRRPDREQRSARRTPAKVAGDDQSLVPRRRPVQRLAVDGQDRGRGAQRSHPSAGGTARDRYVYWPGTAEVPETAAVNIRNRSYTIAVTVHLDSAAAQGVLFSHGARFGGHGLYVKDRKLKYVYNFVGDNEQIVDSAKEIPTGDVVLSAVFEKEGDAMPTTGTLSLYVNDEKVGEGRIMTQPGNFSLVGEGLNVGRDPGEPVTSDYPGSSPFAFVGGTIKDAIVDVSGEPFIDLEKEAIALMARE